MKYDYVLSVGEYSPESTYTLYRGKIVRVTSGRQ